MAAGGIPVGLFGAKLVAIGFGMLLHLRRIHNVVALLTAIYFAVAIVPWARPAADPVTSCLRALI